MSCFVATHILSLQDVHIRSMFSLLFCFVCAQLMARDLIKRGTGGAIVNVSTVLTQIASANQIPYSEYFLQIIR